jgi:hypothetical protein
MIQNYHFDCSTLEKIKTKSLQKFKNKTEFKLFKYFGLCAYHKKT